MLDEWAEKEGTGTIFNSNTGFNLPNGATRSPDISWVRKERLEKLSQEEWEKFLPLCPDFVLELRSRSESLRSLKEKMEEYIENGARLGWLLDPFERQVHIYRPDAAPQVLNNPSKLSGNPVLSGFTLDILALWRAMQKEI